MHQRHGPTCKERVQQQWSPEEVWTDGIRVGLPHEPSCRRRWPCHSTLTPQSSTFPGSSPFHRSRPSMKRFSSIMSGSSATGISCPAVCRRRRTASTQGTRRSYLRSRFSTLSLLDSSRPRGPPGPDVARPGIPPGGDTGAAQGPLQRGKPPATTSEPGIDALPIRDVPPPVRHPVKCNHPGRGKKVLFGNPGSRPGRKAYSSPRPLHAFATQHLPAPLEVWRCSHAGRCPVSEITGQHLVLRTWKQPSPVLPECPMATCRRVSSV